MRFPSSAVLTAVVLLVLAGCTTPDQQAQKPVPDPLNRFYAQKLSWGDCAPYATGEGSQAAFRAEGVECTRLTVPLDYAEPQGDTITVGVLRHKASDPAQRIGSLMMDPGGPGGSGMEAAARVAPTISGTVLAKRFDLVGFDPRGVGASLPRVRCLTDSERDADRVNNATPSDFAAKCAQRTEHGNAMLANLGTRDVARDLDVLRAALGDGKLTYLGYSYGTQIGSAYAEAFPGNVRALLLDGAIDPGQDQAESLIAQGTGFSKAFGLFAEECAHHDGCALDSVAGLDDLLRPLIEQPVTTGDGRKLSYEDAVTGIMESMYSPRSWPLLNAGLNLLKSGDGSVLVELADKYYERAGDGRYTSLQDIYLAVRCVDNPRITDPNRIADAQRRMIQAAPFLGTGRPDQRELDVCASWPVPSTSGPHTPKADGLPPVLVVSTTDDPVTPYQAGVNLARDLKGSLLTFEGTQHTVFLHGSQCVDDAGTAYLLNGTLPATGTRC